MLVCKPVIRTLPPVLEATSNREAMVKVELCPVPPLIVESPMVPVFGQAMVVAVFVRVEVKVGVAVLLGVLVIVGVLVMVAVAVGVALFVGVPVLVEVTLLVGVLVMVGMAVGVNVGLLVGVEVKVDVQGVKLVFTQGVLAGTGVGVGAGAVGLLLQEEVKTKPAKTAPIRVNPIKFFIPTSKALSLKGINRYPT